MDLIKELMVLPVRLVEMVLAVVKDGAAPELKLEGTVLNRRVGFHAKAFLLDRPEPGEPVGHA